MSNAGATTQGIPAKKTSTNLQTQASSSTATPGEIKSRPKRGKEPVNANGGVGILNVDRAPLTLELAKTTLEKGLMVIAGEPYTMEKMIMALKHIAQHSKIPVIMDQINSVAIILETIRDETISNTLTGVINETVVDQLGSPLHRVEEVMVEMKELKEKIENNLEKKEESIKGILGKCEATLENMQSTVDDLKNIQLETKRPMTYAQVARGDEHRPERLERHDHANITGGDGIPEAGEITEDEDSKYISRTQARARQIQIEAKGLDHFTETELLAKANLTLEIMPAGDRPEGMTITMARRLRSGRILLELESRESKEWLERKDVINSYVSHFDTGAIFKDTGYMLVVENVPVNFEVSNQATWDKAEADNGMKRGQIVHARWIKAVNRRTEGQNTAHLVVVIRTPDAANLLIRDRMNLAGMKCTVHKFWDEPFRCLRCQKITKGHSAATCKQIHDTCGTCAGMHRTSGCIVKDPRGYRCSNCNVDGHAAWDRQCPVYISKRNWYNKMSNDSLFKFFPTYEKWTWEKLGGMLVNVQKILDMQKKAAEKRTEYVQNIKHIRTAGQMFREEEPGQPKNNKTKEAENTQGNTQDEERTNEQGNIIVEQTPPPTETESQPATNMTTTPMRTRSCSVPPSIDRSQLPTQPFSLFLPTPSPLKAPRPKEKEKRSEELDPDIDDIPDNLSSDDETVELEKQLQNKRAFKAGKDKKSKKQTNNGSEGTQGTMDTWFAKVKELSKRNEERADREKAGSQSKRTNNNE